MTRPLIGITMDSGPTVRRYALPCAYTSAVERAGGLPVALPFRTDPSLIPQFLDRLDGIIFSGGDDLDPSLFGQRRHPKAKAICPQRQQFELALMAEVEKRRKPALGICLGSQLMNVFRGGSLVQFLPEMDRKNALEHRKLGKSEVRHLVRIEAYSTLHRLFKRREVMANSSHKQAVERPGRGLQVIARSEDGVIEAIEDPTMPLFLGIQWHPERLEDEPDHLALFQLLVAKSAS